MTTSMSMNMSVSQMPQTSLMLSPFLRDKLPSESQRLRASCSLMFPLHYLTCEERLALLSFIVTLSLGHSFQEILFNGRMNG